MSAFELEISAARARVAEIEKKLSDVIATIQSEANSKIVDATRRAMSDIIPLRTFISSVGSELFSSDSDVGGQERPFDAPSQPSRSPPSRPTKKLGGRQKSAALETAKIALLTILSEASDAMDAAALDHAVVARGFKKSSGQKERKKTRDEGLTELLEDGKLSITEKGRALLKTRGVAQ